MTLTTSASRPTTPSERPSPDRPRTLSPDELGYTPQQRVPWLRPQLLAVTAVRAGLAEIFGAYLDKRELQGALPSEGYEHHADGEFWLDYVADLGDGFDATYSVAWLLAQPELRLTDPDRRQHTVPRGQVLVMGGDMAYPTANWKQYEDRCAGPYRSALPVMGEHPPTLYALPGNHDWYDGLTAFLRLFGKSEPMGGWKTRQTRSYFALQLPHRWWLFGIDAQFGAYLDEPQLRYFHAAAERLGPGDKVIICTARPTWVYGAQSPRDYGILDHFIRTVVNPTGATVAMMLSGDKHHYARYAVAEPANPPAGTPRQDAASGTSAPDARPSAAEPDPAAGRTLTTDPASTAGQTHTTGPGPEPSGAPARQLVTCGGGGAYLASTHVLPATIQVPPRRSMRRAPNRSQRYRLRQRYPEPARSRRFARGVFFRLPLRNPGFGTLLAMMHALLLAAYVSAGSQGVPWLSVPALGMSTLVLLAGVGFAAADRNGAPGRRHAVAGLLHGVAHLGIGVVGAILWAGLGIADLHPLFRLVVAVLAYAPVAGFVAGQVVCLYLLLAHRFGINVNELFASQGIEDAKCFLRMRIGPDGSLTLYPVAIDRVCRDWRAAPDDPADAPWIAPEKPLRPRLAEPPVTV